MDELRQPALADCAHESISTFRFMEGPDAGNVALWACADCMRRFAPRAATPPPAEPDHAEHYDPSCEECVYLARPVAIHVPAGDGALDELAAYRAEPPEYPGLVLVPKELLERVVADLRRPLVTGPRYGGFRGSAAHPPAETRLCVECGEPWPCPATVYGFDKKTPHRIGVSSSAETTP